MNLSSTLVRRTQFKTIVFIFPKLKIWDLELLGPYNVSDPLFQVLYTSRLLRNCLGYMLLGVLSAISSRNNTVPPFSLICKTNYRSWSVQIGKILSNSSSSHDFKISANQQCDLCQKTQQTLGFYELRLYSKKHMSFHLPIFQNIFIVLNWPMWLRYRIQIFD